MSEIPTLEVAGAKRVLSPLNFKALRSIGPRLGLLSKFNPAEGIPEDIQDLILEIAGASLKRSYPEITREQIEESLDVSNFPAVIMGALRGWKERASPGEAAGP